MELLAIIIKLVCNYAWTRLHCLLKVLDRKHNFHRALHPEDCAVTIPED